MGLNDLINITVSVSSPHVTQQGFGTPLILSHSAAWAERVRVYEDADAVLADFGANTPEYLAGAAVFAQNPRPERLKIGRSVVKPTQRFKIVPTVVNATHYKLNVIGPDGVLHVADYLSDANATAQEIIDGLKAAIDVFALALTTSNQGPNVSLRVLANNAGDFFSLEAVDAGLLVLEQDHADPGITAELAAIKLADDDWYGLITLFNSTAMVTAAAAWIETQAKIYAAQSQQGDILTASVTDIATALKTAAYVRTAVLYHPKTRAFADAAWFGRVLPTTPGSETWMYKTLAGIPAVTLDATQRTNALAKNANIYETVAGINITEEGKTASGQFIDTTRFVDWQRSDMQVRIFTTQVSNDKVAYSDKGAAQIEADIRASLSAGVDAGGLVDDPKPSVTMPKAKSQADADKAIRKFKNVKWKATLAGAIHRLEISGNVQL